MRAAGAERPALGCLDPEIVASLGSMELRARAVVEGFLLGLHRSPWTGFSAEFSEYRQYMPGDDLSTLDWKVYGRSDRFYVKRFEEETNVDCRILLDVSASMSYHSGAVSKLQYGSYLAAALAWLMNRQRDAVGLLTFDEWVVTNVPVSGRPGHLRRILVALEQIEVGRRSNVSQALNALAAAMRRRGVVVLISDLLDDPDSVVAGLRHLKFRGSEVVVFHVLDPAELEFPFERATRFQDLETGRELTTVASEIRDGYVREMKQMSGRYARELRLAGMEYCQVQTVQPLDAALREYLATRSRR
jgi:uncharacterized protein (DUF58 family)